MKGKVTIVIGGQFGSEAKGKVISFLANEFDIAVRTGSPNAGHTVFKDGEIYRLQQIPATFVNKKCVLYIGAGALINPDILKKRLSTPIQKTVFLLTHKLGLLRKNIFCKKVNLYKKSEVQEKVVVQHLLIEFGEKILNSQKMF